MRNKNLQTSFQQQTILSNQPSFIVKIHIGLQQQVEINLTTDSNIDSIIQDCIDKYKLKKQAHAFLKRQINAFMGYPKDNFRCKTQQNVSNLFGQKNKETSRIPLAKKKGFIKDLKLEDIDKNKIIVQRTPKNSENFSFKKQHSFKATSKVQSNPKIFLKKKAQSQKQNIEHFVVPIKNNFKEPRSLTPNNKPQKTLLLTDNSQTKTKNDSVIIKTEEQISKQGLSFLENDNLFSSAKPQKLKTESSCIQNEIRMKQFSLLDLQKQMNEQLIDLKYEKKIKRLQPQLCNIFGSIIRYNPPKISKIDPRYACFQDLSEKVIKGLHELLTNLNDQQLNSLDFQNFKKLLVKYRGDYLLDNLK